MLLSRIVLVGLVSATVSGCLSDAQVAFNQSQEPVPAVQAVQKHGAKPHARAQVRVVAVEVPAIRKRMAVASARPVAVVEPTPAQPVSAPVARVADGPHEGPAPTIDAMVARHAHDLGIPPGLAMAVVGIESRGNPRATNHGAMGLMQIKVQTARSQGFQGDASGLLSPDTNLTYGMKVLAAAYRTEGGDVCRTLAAYQSGHRVARFSAAQRHYCARARLMMAHS